MSSGRRVARRRGDRTIQGGPDALPAAARQLIVYGFASRRQATLSARALESLLYRPALNQSITGFNVGAFFVLRPEVAGPAIGRLLGMLAAGEVRVPLHRTMPLSDAADAHRLIERREAQGKIVLKPWST